MHNHVDTIIDLLDGGTAVSEICGITPGAVSQWKKQIPPAHIPRIMEASRERGKPLTAEQILGFESIPEHYLRDLPAAPPERRNGGEHG